MPLYMNHVEQEVEMPDMSSENVPVNFVIYSILEEQGFEIVARLFT